MKPVWLWWSTGKDSAWTLQVLNGSAEFQVTRLVSTVNAEFERVAMHAVRVELARRQAAAAGLELHVAPIPHPCPNSRYEETVAEVVDLAKAAGVSHMAFGDLFLEDIRRYREALFSPMGVEPVFPLWGSDTRELAGKMIASGVSAYITCVDPRCLAADFAGRRFDEDLLADLPGEVDPCGERGEFHTFANRGPMFSDDIPVSVGERVEREGFVFSDLVPEPA
jgi:uncharacterized protein (TIGR00290 family)